MPRANPDSSTDGVHATPLAPIERPAPLAQRAYDAIRASLLTGGSSSTERLTEEELASGLGMSRTPVREALHRLALAGIVVPASGGGYRPRRTTRRDVIEQCELRLELEPTAAMLVAERAPDFADELAHHPLLMEGADPLTELEFHVAIANGSANETLASLILAVNDRFAVHRVSLRRRHSVLSWPSDGPAAIVAAIATGRGDAAARAMREHLERVQTAIVAAVDEAHGVTA
jgi:DNA-binding GntR family transcriptional regulator